MLEAAKGHLPGLSLEKRENTQTKIHLDVEYCSAVKKEILRLVTTR